MPAHSYVAKYRLTDEEWLVLMDLEDVLNVSSCIDREMHVHM